MGPCIGQGKFPPFLSVSCYLHLSLSPRRVSSPSKGTALFFRCRRGCAAGFSFCVLFRMIEGGFSEDGSRGFFPEMDEGGCLLSIETAVEAAKEAGRDRKSTRLNSSHVKI